MRKLYMAPMEGLTGYSFRRQHAAAFGPVDRYFTPFIVPSKERAMRTREKQEILPENNTGLPVIPQVLTNRPELFVELARVLGQMGYTELNLNLGCPSGTVTAKGRGAGFLADPDGLDRFLEEIFRDCPLAISVKTRLGIEDPMEFERILSIYNRYPMTELILHPRVLKEFYRGEPHWDLFRMAAENCVHPLIYNGNLFTEEQTARWSETFPEERYPNVTGIMLGRGLVADPGLAATLQGRSVSLDQVRRFHDGLYGEKKQILSGDKNLLCQMKEVWFYLGQSFRDAGKDMKKLKKINRAQEYEAWADHMFRHGVWDPTAGFRPPMKG